MNLEKIMDEFRMTSAILADELADGSLKDDHLKTSEMVSMVLCICPYLLTLAHQYEGERWKAS